MTLFNCLSYFINLRFLQRIHVVEKKNHWQYQTVKSLWQLGKGRLTDFSNVANLISDIELINSVIIIWLRSRLWAWLPVLWHDNCLKVNRIEECENWVNWEFSLIFTGCVIMSTHCHPVICRYPPLPSPLAAILPAAGRAKYLSVKLLLCRARVLPCFSRPQQHNIT